MMFDLFQDARVFVHIESPGKGTHIEKPLVWL